MRHHRAFTLIELLVVVAIIVALLAIMLPSMHRAVATAQIAVCASNQRQIGTAQMSYLVDSQRVYPVLHDWAPLVGKRGDTAYYSANGTDVTDRPLNRYLSSTTDGDRVDVAMCPADLGDSLYTDSSNCYLEYGTSYLPAWGFDVFRIKAVYGITGGQASMTLSQITKTSNKLLLSDWAWHGNRAITDGRTRWHNPGEVRQFNTLFADNHVEYFIFPIEFIEMAITGSAVPAPPDPGFLWW